MKISDIERIYGKSLLERVMAIRAIHAPESRAKTLQGVLCAVRNSQRMPKPSGICELGSNAAPHPSARRRIGTPPNPQKWTVIPWASADSAAVAHEMVATNGRKRLRVEPTDAPDRHHRQYSVNESRYGEWPRYVYCIDYYSVAMVSRSGRCLRLERMVGDQIVSRQILIRADDIRWEIDSLGLMVRSRDGTEYHPMPEDLERSDVLGHLRRQLAAARAARRAVAARKADEADLLAAASDVPVALQDARRAGLCVAGVTQWCAQQGIMDRDQVVSPYASVPGRVLLRTGDDRARRAVICAAERHTLVSI